MTYYVASWTSGQRLVKPPTHVEIRDAHGDHRVKVEPWDKGWPMNDGRRRAPSPDFLVVIFLGFFPPSYFTRLDFSSVELQSLVGFESFSGSLRRFALC